MNRWAPRRQVRRHLTVESLGLHHGGRRAAEQRRGPVARLAVVTITRADVFVVVAVLLLARAQIWARPSGAAQADSGPPRNPARVPSAPSR